MGIVEAIDQAFGLAAGEKLMSVEHFQRFAAECEAMAYKTRSPKDKEVWIRLAERWRRCAALMEREEADVRARRRTERKTIH